MNKFTQEIKKDKEFKPYSKDGVICEISLEAINDNLFLQIKKVHSTSSWQCQVDFSIIKNHYIDNFGRGAGLSSGLAAATPALVERLDADIGHA